MLSSRKGHGRHLKACTEQRLTPRRHGKHTRMGASRRMNSLTLGKISTVLDCSTWRKRNEEIESESTERRSFIKRMLPLRGGLSLMSRGIRLLIGQLSEPVFLELPSKSGLLGEAESLV